MLEKIRSYRIFGLAIFDLVLALIGMIAVFLWAHRTFFPTLPVQNFVIAAVLLTIPVGIFTHVLFGTSTALNHLLGLSTSP